MGLPCDTTQWDTPTDDDSLIEHLVEMPLGDALKHLNTLEIATLTVFTNTARRYNLT